MMPAAAATVLTGHHSGYSNKAGTPNNGSPPAARKNKETKKATIEPILLAFLSNNAMTS